MYCYKYRYNYFTNFTLQKIELTNLNGFNVLCRNYIHKVHYYHYKWKTICIHAFLRISSTITSHLLKKN